MEYAWGLAASRRPFPGEFKGPKPRSRFRPRQSFPRTRRANTDASLQNEGHYCQCGAPTAGEQSDWEGLPGLPGGQSPTHSPCATAAPAAAAAAAAAAAPAAAGPPAGPPAGPSAGPPAAAAAASAAAPVVRTNTTPPGPPPGSPPLSSPAPDQDVEPAAPGLSSWPSASESPSSSTLVCASCNKPIAADSGALLSNSSSPSSRGQAGDSSQPGWSPRNLRRQSHPEFTRTVPVFAIPHPGATTPIPSRQFRPALRTGRHTLSVPASYAATPFDRDRHHSPRNHHHHAAMAGGDSNLRSQSVSAATSQSSRTLMSGNDLASMSRDEDESSNRSRQNLPRSPFVTKSNGRIYLSDPTLAYPLPVDLHELHRQSLRSLLLFQLFGGPVCSPAVVRNPPTRVLDVACGYGFWSMMCHSYFSRKGHPNISFTGLDIAPLGGIAGMPNPGNVAPPTAPRDRGSVSSAAGNWAEQPPDKNMQWNFVQHDLRVLPLPFPDNEFDLVMCKEVSLVARTTQFQPIIDEYLRILKPGGTLEVWDCDHPIRMLRPHVPDTPTTGTAPRAFDPESSASANGGDASNGGSKQSEQENQITELGAYYLGNNTPLSGPQNNFLIEYNSWLCKFLESHELLQWPCANLGPFLIQEPLLTGHGSKRLAIPLTEVRWEREGVGGVVTKDGKSYIDTGKSVGRGTTKISTGESAPEVEKKGKTLGAAQLALRQAALQSVLGFIEGLEPALREVSGKKQDEWDTWMGKLMKELIEKDGASCGECLEVGAWWARKVRDSS